MIKILFFVAVFAVGFGVAIHAWQTLSGSERWNLTKIAGYAILCSTLSVLTLSAIVLFF
jgi:hypothetical protein